MMGLLDALRGKRSAPQNVSDLLGACQDLINSAKYQEATQTAHAFVVQYRDNPNFSQQEGAGRQAYGYYMLCVSTLKQIETGSPSQRYELLVAFFASNAMARRAFQVSMGWRVGDSLEDLTDHSDYPFAKQVRTMYQKVYDTYNRAEVEKADADAHEQLRG